MSFAAIYHQVKLSISFNGLRIDTQIYKATDKHAMTIDQLPKLFPSYCQITFPWNLFACEIRFAKYQFCPPLSNLWS